MPRTVAPLPVTPRAPAGLLRGRRRRARRGRLFPLPPAFALFLLLAAIYVLTSGGRTYSYDEETMFGLTESLVERGNVAVPTCAGCTVVHSSPAPDGRNYSRYGPLQSLAAVPLYLVGRAAAGDDAAARWFLTRFAADLLNPLLTAGIGALLYTFVRALGYRRGAALMTALVYGLGTQAWPRAKTFFSEPLTTLLILAAVYCWWRLDAGADERPLDPRRAMRHTAGIGLGAGLAIATKFGAVIVLPVISAAVALTLLRHHRAGRLTRQAAGLAVGAGAMALMIPVALVGLYNSVRFAAPFETGYGGAEVGAIQGGGFLNGLGGLLISPGKSIALFSPPVLLALVAWPVFARRHRRLALVVGGLVFTHLLFYARVPYWHGDVAWGPRYLDFVLPLALLPLASGVEWVVRQPSMRRRATWAAAAPVLLLTLAVQLLGVTVNFNTGFSSAGRGDRYWTGRNSPPLLHATILRARLAEWRDARMPRRDSVIPGAGFALLNETDEPWPRFLPREARLRLHADGDGVLRGAILYEDARDRREPPQRFAILIDGRPAADQSEKPGPAPASYRIDFVVRPAGSTEHDFTVTIRNDAFGVLGPTRLLAFAASRDGRDLPLSRRPLILPFPDSDAERWSWFHTDRNHHLLDIWPWYLAVLQLPGGLSRLLTIGVGGGALLAALLAGISLLRSGEAG